jgi:hypothetical protein
MKKSIALVFLSVLLFSTSAVTVPKSENRNTNISNAYVNDDAGNVAQSTVTSIHNPDTLSPALIAPNGTLNIGDLIRLVGDNFVSGRALLAHIWTESFTGSGSTSTADGELILSTGIVADSAAMVESFNTARFITATFNLTHQAIANIGWDNVNVDRIWGAIDNNLTDGVAFRNLGGAISVVRYKNSILVEEVLEANFNGNESYIKSDDTKIYEIFYNAGTIFFEQNGNLIHKMQSLDAAAFGTPHLNIGHIVKNINGNTTNNEMTTRGSSISRIGSSSAVPRAFIIDSVGTFVIKNTPGKLHNILITDKGAGQATIEVYNNIVAAAPKLVSDIDTSNVQGNLNFNVEFDDALTVVVGGSGVAITITYD